MTGVPLGRSTEYAHIAWPVRYALRPLTRTSPIHAMFASIGEAVTHLDTLRLIIPHTSRPIAERFAGIGDSYESPIPANLAGIGGQLPIHHTRRLCAYGDALSAPHSDASAPCRAPCRIDCVLCHHQGHGVTVCAVVTARLPKPEAGAGARAEVGAVLRCGHHTQHLEQPSRQHTAQRPSLGTGACGAGVPSPIEWADEAIAKASLFNGIP